MGLGMNLYLPLFFSFSPILLQALRLFRILRLNISMKKFLFKVLGGGTRLAVVILMTLVFLIWFSVISMQFFGFLNPMEGCERVSDGHFDNFLQVHQLIHLSSCLLPPSLPPPPLPPSLPPSLLSSFPPSLRLPFSHIDFLTEYVVSPSPSL